MSGMGGTSRVRATDTPDPRKLARLADAGRASLCERGNLLDFLRLSPLEKALGLPIEQNRYRPADSRPELLEESAREALEGVIEDAIVSGNGHLAVMFSGGRDSSAVLAVATAVCRRLGADDPLPVTATYPQDPDTDEWDWREVVLKHLGLSKAVEIEITTERRMLSSRTLASLDSWGVVWPPAVYTQSLYFGSAPRAVFLTGEGGDGVLEGGRITPLTLVRQDFPRVSRSLLRSAAEALAPDVVHQAFERRAFVNGRSLPWLRTTKRQVIARSLDFRRDPLHWGTGRFRVAGQRSVQLVVANSRFAAKLVGTDLRHPLLDDRFVAAIARDGGKWGYRGRTDVFRHLFGDLLPDRILARTTKAAFNTSRWGDDERDFAAGWTGQGIDLDLIDPDFLRNEWSGHSPHPVAQFLIHEAWLASVSQGGARR